MENPSKKPVAIRNIRFEGVAQIELIKKAARHRGVSFNAFVVRVMEAAAEQALQMPGDPLIGFIMPPVRAAGPSEEAAA